MTQKYSYLSFHNLTPEQMVLRVSVLSVVTALILIILKTVAVAESGSLAMLASLTDSALDLLASLITFFAVRFAKKPPDKEHPFGHGKAEAFSALIQAGLVFASAALILRDAWDHWRDPPIIEAGLLAMGVMIISLSLTLALIWAQSYALKASGSIAISADRSHYTADLAGNLVAMIGVGVASLGVACVDTLAGVIIALWLVWGAIKVLREAADHLMDRALEDTDIMRIQSAVMLDRLVLGVHNLKTRVSGPYVLIQMHMELDPDLSLARAHEIIIGAEKRVLAEFPNADILIHPDPKGFAEPHIDVFKRDRLNPTG
jgi:ferrous-iron efflux pump FieF